MSSPDQPPKDLEREDAQFSLTLIDILNDHGIYDPPTSLIDALSEQRKRYFAQVVLTLMERHTRDDFSVALGATFDDVLGLSERWADGEVR